jgi:predicted phosphoadenosine phosphosulfate sulfurtransferase
MKMYLKENVFNAGLDRMRFLFEEFPNVVVCTSGGKDSTVTMNLALRVAEEKGRLPLKVVFFDQEAEWQTVIDYIKTLKEDPRIDLRWYQIPIKIENATSNQDSYLITWEPGKKWMREMEPGSIREPLPTQIFYELFTAMFAKEFSDTKSCWLSGVRAQESPTRYSGLTGRATYKYITYGKKLNKEKQHYTFYPLYDWQHTDIWKAIHDNGWPYCKIYDYMYQHGVKLESMRVSNLNHETALHSLYYLPEIENDTWNNLTARLQGIDSARRISKTDFLSCPKALPFMFESWQEYRQHLLDNLITDPVIHKRMGDKFIWMDAKYKGMHHIEDMIKAQITCILANDSWMTKLTNWERRPEVNGWRHYKKGKHHEANKRNKHITG